MIALPSVAELRRITKSLATLDLILEPEWQYRYFSYNAGWDDGQEMASMRNGSGDEWFLLFEASGQAALKGLDHESEAARIDGFSQQLQNALPESFETFRSEPAFNWEATSFCYWNRGGDAAWEEPSAQTLVQTGAEGLLSILTSGPEGYRDWASEYHETEMDLAPVRAVFEHQLLSEEWTAALNPDIDLESIQAELKQTGYPDLFGG